MVSLRSIGRATRGVAGGFLVAALFYSPWDYGGTGASSIRNLNWILGAMSCLWLIGTVTRWVGRRKREGAAISDPGYRKGFFSWVLLTASALLLLIGWGMALNARAFFDADYSVLVPLTSALPSTVGSADYALSIAMMRRVTVLLACVWVVADLVQDEQWLLRIWWVIGLAGGSIALLGLLQKATGAEMIFWEPLDPNEPPIKSFFATYYYHANAGAYLNLTLPAILGLAARSVIRPSNPAVRALWIALSVIMIVAVFSDTSRMGQLIATVILLTLAIYSAGKIFRGLRRLDLKTAITAVLVATSAFWAVSQASHLEQSWQRWGVLNRSWASDGRWLVDKAAIAALPESGALGFGPGTFSVVFPYFNRLDERAQGDWFFLHNDYLQTLMEWGWIGGILWGIVFLGGVIVAERRLEGKRVVADWIPRRRLLVPLAIVALGGVGLHALVDFPLQISSIQLYAATWLGICWSACSKQVRVES